MSPRFKLGGQYRRAGLGDLRILGRLHARHADRADELIVDDQDFTHDWLREGAVLEKGCVYVIPLLESLDLKATSGVSGFANPKSSTGRLDILTRLIADRSSAFDHVERGYAGPLYVEVTPRTFSPMQSCAVLRSSR